MATNKEQTNLTPDKGIKARANWAIKHGYFADAKKPNLTAVFELLLTKEMQNRGVPLEVED